MKTILAVAMALLAFTAQAQNSSFNAPSRNVQTSAIVGTSTNDSAAAGRIGEYLSATTTQASPTGLTSNVSATVATISLTAGDWDVSAIGGVTGGGTTAVNFAKMGVSTTTNVLPANEETWTVSYPSGGSIVFNNEVFISGSIPGTRVSVAATTPVYLVVRCNFAFSTCSGFGRISARRVR